MIKTQNITMDYAEINYATFENKENLPRNGAALFSVLTDDLIDQVFYLEDIVTYTDDRFGMIKFAADTIENMLEHNERLHYGFIIQGIAFDVIPYEKTADFTQKVFSEEIEKLADN